MKKLIKGFISVDPLYWVAIFVITICVIALTSCVPRDQVLNIRLIEDIYRMKTPQVAEHLDTKKLILYRSSVSHVEIKDILNERITIYFKSSLAVRITINPRKYQQDFELTIENFKSLIDWLGKCYIPIWDSSGVPISSDDFIKRLGSKYRKER